MPAWPMRLPSSRVVVRGSFVADDEVVVIVEEDGEGCGDGDGGKTRTKARMPLCGDVTIASR